MKKQWVLAGLMLLPGFGCNVAQAGGVEPILGEIDWVAFNFAPRGYALCNGQSLTISQNTALFSLLGTQYGGDGVVTFALPDMRGRSPIALGQGAGLSPHVQGDIGGVENVTLTVNQIPPHTHAVAVTSGKGNKPEPTGDLFARPAMRDGAGGLEDSKVLDYATASTAQVAMSSDAIGVTGGNQPIDNMPPSLALTCVIAIQGIYPARQ